ncbi:hypothetical protein [Sphingomonas jatrophae]|uniref:Uncharacterized protein n=1 Tax=Sphingomonas jatrophae TaxID=1166337 RepID=A0A1I6JAG7_9SPHN|nr:hypothetical protein [Sphingomonas jatrophae]SFR75924.1 hypothetical protein SAMN05192580_0028 [Sphingomonas jatrophae]
MANLDALRADDEDSGDKSLVILQTLLCLLREKNLLTRADIEDLCERVAVRAQASSAHALPCRRDTAEAAAAEMAKIGSFIGSTYGGKHRRM